jgi:oligoendopeptidase F
MFDVHVKLDGMTQINPQAWQSLEPHFQDLQAQTLDATNVEPWLQTWSDLEAQIYEAYSRAYRAKMEDTTNQAAEDAFLHLLENILPPVSIAANQLKQKLLAFTEYQPTVQTQHLHKRIRAEAEIFRAENVPLQTELGKLGVEYDKIVGSLEIEFEGQKITFYAATAKLELPDRTLRERVFKAMLAEWSSVRHELDAIFMKMLPLRRQIAQNAGFDNYREYIWLEKTRFDYSTDDSQNLHQIIFQTVVPISNTLREQRRSKLSLKSTRPWDVYLEYDGKPALQPFSDVTELETKISNMFHALAPELGTQFDTLRVSDLDLDSRAGKGPGGYCDFFPASGKAYIFMNAVGTQDDVQTMLHEGGHAFHALESFQHQDLHWNYHGPMEFCEVASMGMELLASPYLEQDKGGFYSLEDAKRARVNHLRGSGVLFLPYMAVVDAFQHWLYADAPETVSIAQIHAKWSELHQKFIPSIDFEGIEDALSMRWHLQSHIFTAPFYYIEYGIAQLGALQLWQHSLKQPRETVQQYLQALGLGYTKGLADLFSAAGIKLPFDAQLVKGLMQLVSAHLEL